MKLLVIGIDAVSPDILFNNLDILPNISKLVEDGTSGSYIGYTYGYGSRDNWISMYTGLTPEQHGTVNNIYAKSQKAPRLYDYKKHQPFWKVLNDNGFAVGLWKAMSTSPPEPINGFIAGGEYTYEAHAIDPEIWSDAVKFHPSLAYLEKKLIGEPTELVSPKSPEEVGLSWEELNKNPELYYELMTPDYFQESLGYLKSMLDYHLKNIEQVTSEKSVDLFWFYDPIFDYISHFQMHDPNKKVVIQALKIIDDFVGRLIDILKPENVIFISDHGQLSFGEHFPNMSIEHKKEAFGLANQSHFVDEYIFLPARNGGVLTAVHSPEATFIGSGPIFKKGEILTNEYRTLDIYPLVLEIFNCVIPQEREGFVPNVLNRSAYINKVYPDNPEVEDVLIVSTLPVYDLNAFINQYFWRHRFHRIHVIAEEKYVPAFQVNPHVYDCFRIEEFLEISISYKKIIIPRENTKYSLNYDFYILRT